MESSENNEAFTQSEFRLFVGALIAVGVVCIIGILIYAFSLY
jgi:hypothetical protein